MVLTLLLLGCSEPPVPPEPPDAHVVPDPPRERPAEPTRPAVRCTLQETSGQTTVTAAVTGGDTWAVSPIAGACRAAAVEGATCGFVCGEDAAATTLKIAWDGPRLTAWTRPAEPGSGPWTRHWRAEDPR